MRRLLLLGLGPFVLGCGLRAPSADGLLLRYARSLLGDDPQVAYRLLDEPTRSQVSYEMFAQRWRETAEERRAQALALGRAGSPPLHATITLGDGAQLRLVQARGLSGSWLLSDTRLDDAKPQSPEEALRLLLAAVDRRSYAAVLRILTPAQRQVIEAELRERIDRLRSALHRKQPLDIKGDRARLQYDARFYIDLKKESDGWRVQDLN